MSRPDCWNGIGVWGREKPRCVKLKQVTHCRNCEVYKQAGRQLLERPLPVEYLQDLAQHFRRTKAVAETAESALIFRLGDEYLALPTIVFDEVVAVRPSHTVPHRSNAIFSGLVNLNGRLEPRVSLGGLLGVLKTTESSQGDTTRLLVMRARSGIFAFPVSEVVGTYRPPVDTIKPIFESFGSEQKLVYLKHTFLYKNITVGFLDYELVADGLESALGR